ncbi:MAG: DnaD domain protein [Oscillospiraceae bacterium]|jgi:DNA replication protein DnaD|nr:DnaD domain protein [Oscillospiraceae bacterium]
MADMKFTLPGPETITLSGQNTDKLIRLGDGDAALLYLYILKTRGQSSVRESADALRRTEEAILAAMTHLGKLGLIRYDELPAARKADAPPAVTARDIQRELEHGAAFYHLVQEAQKSLGKVLSSDDLIKLFGLYDALKLPPEVILQLIGYCLAETRRQYGEGRVPTMRYIEKAAYTWEREGIFSLEKAETYLKEREKRKTAAFEVKKALQIRDRDMTPSEKRYVDGWLALGFEAEAIGMAYDRTALKTGKLAWGYLDSIINSWHGKGLHTPEEIDARDGKAKPAGKHPPAAAPDADELARMQKLLDKINEG